MSSTKESLKEFKKLRIVTIGGGHGLSSLLRGLKKVTRNITAVVTVADNGGSSGALRRDMGILPPGDIRSCLTALADDEEFMTQVLQYRFSSASGVGQHNMGNLLLTALADITGSFEQGIHELASILAIRGKVTPSTLANINLAADIEVENDGVKTIEQVTGESQITETYGRILRCWIEPENVSANPEAIRAILNADLLLMGPGSLFTSILPNLLVPGIANAVAASSAKKLYICNLTSQPGETDNMDSADHFGIIQSYIPETELDGMVCNDFYPESLPSHINWCKICTEKDLEIRIIKGNLVDENYPWRHDPDKLTNVLIQGWEAMKEPPEEINTNG